MHWLIKIIVSLKDRLFNLLGFSPLKQEAMLKLALKEVGLNYKKLHIIINHVDGMNIVNGVELPIIYPKSFFEKANQLHSLCKSIKFYFNGDMSESGERRKMLNNFMIENSQIIESSYGRSRLTKDKFNQDYYFGLASSKFGLCPHQKDFEGNRDTMWTYRFIECCMVHTIPVLFKEAPLGYKFINGFHYLWDDEVLQNDIQYCKEHALENYRLCIKMFTLSNDQVKRISARSVNGYLQ